jgi:hypothetical protein
MEFSYGYDITNFPLAVLTISGIPNNDSQINAFLDDWARLYEVSMKKNQKHKLLFDVRKTDSIPFNYLIMIAKFLIKMKKSNEQWMDRTAILVSNPTIKNLIAIVFKFYRPVRPFKVLDDSNESIQWLMSSDKGDINDYNNVIKEDTDTEEEDTDSEEEA